MMIIRAVATLGGVWVGGGWGVWVVFFFFFNDTATTEIYTLSLHDALPIYVFCISLWNGWRDGVMDRIIILCIFGFMLFS